MHQSWRAAVPASGIVMGFLLGAAIVSVAFTFFVLHRARSSDEALDRALNAMHAEARRKLPPDDLARLHQQLLELSALTHAQAANGVPGKAASRMGKQAAMQTIAGAIEIERMFSAKTAA